MTKKMGRPRVAKDSVQIAIRISRKQMRDVERAGKRMMLDTRASALRVAITLGLEVMEGRAQR